MNTRLFKNEVATHEHASARAQEDHIPAIRVIAVYKDGILLQVR